MHLVSPRCSLLGCCVLAASCTFAFAQDAAKPDAPPAVRLMSPSETFEGVLSSMEKDFVGAAEAMPEERYNFAPPATDGEFKGVRTFADQVRHVTETNNYFFQDFTQTMVDRSADVEKLKTKAEIVKALKDSFALAHVYLRTMTPENAFVVNNFNMTRAGNSAYCIAHFMDHYGQMVEYLRMNGIVPPASNTPASHT